MDEDETATREFPDADDGDDVHGDEEEQEVHDDDGGHALEPVVSVHVGSDVWAGDNSGYVAEGQEVRGDVGVVVDAIVHDAGVVGMVEEPRGNEAAILFRIDFQLEYKKQTIITLAITYRVPRHIVLNIGGRCECFSLGSANVYCKLRLVF